MRTNGICNDVYLANYEFDTLFFGQPRLHRSISQNAHVRTSVKSVPTSVIFLVLTIHIPYIHASSSFDILTDYHVLVDDDVVRDSYECQKALFFSPFVGDKRPPAFECVFQSTTGENLLSAYESDHCSVC